MAYCRKLRFEEEPNYQFCISLFQKCMKRHNMQFNPATLYWKQNFLSRDKQALKDSMMNIIKKKPKAVAGVTSAAVEASNMPAAKGSPVKQREKPLEN